MKRKINALQPYAVSKAALNMLTIQYHNELVNEGKEGAYILSPRPYAANVDFIQHSS